VREQLEIGGLFLAAAFAVAQTSESPVSPGDGPLFPITYLVLAFLVASFQRRVGVALGISAVALDGICWWLRGARVTELPALAAHAGFLLLFAVLFHAVLAARLGAARRAERAAVARRMRDIEQRARDFRLLAPAASGTDDDEWERRTLEAAVVEVESALRGACGVAAAALRARSAAVFTVTEDDRELRLREFASTCAPARRVPAGEGPLAAVVHARTPVRLDGDLVANWCDGGPKPRAMLAVPLLERRGHVRGVLLVDRVEPQPFTDDDERLLSTVASEILRAMDSERLMSDLKRAREEKEHFYQALERLNRTSKAREVCDAVLEVAGGMVKVDFGAVTLTDDRSGALRHRIVRVAPGEHAGSGVFEGAEFEDKGIVASVVRLAASLPGRDLDLDKAVIFDEGMRVKGLSSLKVLPLKTGDRVLGTLIVGARDRGRYGPDDVRQLEVVAMQAAEAILRARLFDETERLATTDGLTGLLNHRVFQSRLDEHVAAAVRYSKKLSFLLTDVDHFKKVNDTYGHPAGDEVLRGVARILAREARSTDLVARYGGEEFAIVMPETDAAGAMVIAERIREKVAAAIFRTGAGDLRATISIGIATSPDHAKSKARLVELADAALYRAKRGGRNRTVAAGQREAA
jgi:diguanylate cyclase (GGDEF)-like protein